MNAEQEYEKKSHELAQMTIAHDQIPPSDIESRCDEESKNESKAKSLHRRIQRYDSVIKKSSSMKANLSFYRRFMLYRSSKIVKSRNNHSFARRRKPYHSLSV